MLTTDNLLSSYFSWLETKTRCREVGGWVEITTTFLDRHNDYIQIYSLRQGNGWLLSDDGYTLADLSQSDYNIKPTRLAATLLHHAVQQNFRDALEFTATGQDFPLRLHNLLQAILAVNGLANAACVQVKPE